MSLELVEDERVFMGLESPAAGDEKDSFVGSDVIVFNNFVLLERFSAYDELMRKIEK